MFGQGVRICLRRAQGHSSANSRIFSCVCVSVINRSSALPRPGKVCACARVPFFLLIYVWQVRLCAEHFPHHPVVIFSFFVLCRYANDRAEKNCENCGVYSVVGPLNWCRICTHIWFICPLGVLMVRNPSLGCHDLGCFFMYTFVFKFPFIFDRSISYNLSRDNLGIYSAPFEVNP